MELCLYICSYLYTYYVFKCQCLQVILNLGINIFYNSRLQELIESINDTLEELKYHLADLKGQLEDEEETPDH